MRRLLVIWWGGTREAGLCWLGGKTYAMHLRQPTRRVSVAACRGAAAARRHARTEGAGGVPAGMALGGSLSPPLCTHPPPCATKLLCLMCAPVPCLARFTPCSLPPPQATIARMPMLRCVQEVVDLIGQCMSLDPQDRPSAQQLLARLEELEELSPRGDGGGKQQAGGPGRRSEDGYRGGAP